jgi:DNA-binding response OmpR family regulator
MERISLILLSDNESFTQVISGHITENDIEIISVAERNVISQVKKNQPDALLLDTDTVNIDAVAIAKDLKKRFPHIPQLIITKSKDPAYLDRFLKIPIEDFVIKPVDPNILLERVKMMLNKTISNNRFLKNSDLEIDEWKKEARYKNKILELSAKEFRLLKYLLINADRVLSRLAILNHVWGFDTYVVDRSVDVYIGYIRKKIKKIDPSFQMIKTIPSFGYMLESKTSG